MTSCKDCESGKKDMLAETIMHETLDLHEQAEKCSYILRMVESRVSRPQYRLLLADLHVIYAALEEEADKLKDDPVYGAMYCPDELNRKEALEQDLTYFYGPKWRKLVQPTKTALKYVDHIHHIGRTQPSLLLAHAFVRYLGDLSGGQVLKFKMTRSMDLPETGEGTRFYEFSRVRHACRLKNYLIGRVNNLELDPELYDRILKEARVAFKMNIDVFEDLEVGAERLARMMHPTPNIELFEKVWQASTVVLSFAVMYNLSTVIQHSV